LPAACESVDSEAKAGAAKGDTWARVAMIAQDNRDLENMIQPFIGH
jgi:hypothetical protein